jgi:hypothetical protein
MTTKMWVCSHGNAPMSPPDHIRLDPVLMDRWWQHELSRARHADVRVVLIGEPCEVCGRKYKEASGG